MLKRCTGSSFIVVALCVFHRNGRHIDRKYAGYMGCIVIKKDAEEWRYLTLSSVRPR